MNKSYSKIRHIQESNQRLEKRLLNEKIGGRDIHEIDEYIKWDIKTVDCEGTGVRHVSEINTGTMSVDYDDDNAIVRIRYCEGDHEELEHLKNKARKEIQNQNELPDDDGDNYNF